VVENDGLRADWPSLGQSASGTSFSTSLSYKYLHGLVKAQIFLSAVVYAPKKDQLSSCLAVAKEEK